MQERERQGIDVATLKDETSWKQNVIFSAVVIKDEKQAIEMIKLFLEMGA